MLIVILIFASTACIVSIDTGGIPLATYTPLPINTPTLKGTIQCKVSEVLGTNVAAGKNIVSRSGGVTYNQ
jgi:hypothetical protein